MTTFIIVVAILAGVCVVLNLIKSSFYRRLLERNINRLQEKCGEKKTDFQSSIFDSVIDERMKAANEPRSTAQSYSYVIPPTKPKPLIENDVLKFMIKACHPDKHALDPEKEVLAAAATDWLVKQKNKQKREGF